jgi:anti-anti-sigma factor
MSAMQATERNITAPETLGLDTRAAFREVAMRELAEMPAGGTLVLDLSGTIRVDSAGLSVLMLIQRQSEDRSQHVVLRQPSDELTYLLALTQMTDLFRIER